MKHFTIVANWKMHQTPKQAVWLLEKLQEKAKPQTHVTTVLCAPFIDLPAMHEKVESDIIKLGAQNLNDQDEGKFTGEVSGPMLRGLAQYVIVGHSERRMHFHETDKQIGLKVAAAIRNNLKPILCVGEKLTEREAGSSRRVIVDQLRGSLSQISDDDIRKLIITYEPVWAISSGDGKGHFADPQSVAEMVVIIRETIEDLFGEAASSQVEVLYGGSANPDDARGYLELEHINGLLVGGASLNYEQFSSIMAQAAELTKSRAS